MSPRPHHLRRTLVVTLVAALAHGNAIAEEPASQGAPISTEEVRLPAVSVTAPAIAETQPLNANVVNSETLRTLRPATSDSASLLKWEPGVDLQGGGGVSNLPVVRGMADDRNRIKVDGMDIISACENHMNPALSYIDPSHVGSATIFAGITPVSLGGDSIGSTIQVESPEPEFAKDGEGLLHKGEVGAFYRSNGKARGGNLSATLASESLSLTYSGSTAEAENYRAAEEFKTKTTAYVNDVGDPAIADDKVGSTMYKSTNQSLALGLRGENHLVELKAGMQDIPYQGYVNQRMDMTGNDSTHVNLRYEGQLDWGTLEARAYNEHTRHHMQFYTDKLYWYGPTSPANYTTSGVAGPIGGCPLNIPIGNYCRAAGMPMDTEGYNSGAVLKADIHTSSGDRLRVGSEAQRYRLDDWWDPAGKGMWPNVFWSIKDGERDRLALFGEWEAQWSPQWLTQLGLRGEQVNMNSGEVQGYNASYDADAAAFNNAERNFTDNNLDLTAIARFTPQSTSSVEFGYAQKSRSPNLYERYSWSTGGMAMRMINWFGDGNGYVGNLKLQPEVAHTVSATFALRNGGEESWGVKLSPYYTYVSDYIDVERLASSVGVVDDFVYLRFINQTARIYGMDISGHYTLAENSAFGSFTATGKISYVRGKNSSTDGNLYNMMPLNARLALEQHSGNWTNTIESELVSTKENVSATRNEMKTAGYGLLHLRSSYAWKQARFDVGIENLLDRFYNHPLGGAYFGEGATMPGSTQNGIQWGTPVPGMGRSFYAGVNLKF